MKDDNTKALGKVIRIGKGEIRGHLNQLVRGTVEETLNALLDEEAGQMCRAQRYERSPDRIDTRAGHYTRKLHPTAGEVQLNMPELRRQTFETAIIERYRRRDISIEEAIVQMYLAVRQRLQSVFQDLFLNQRVHRVLGIGLAARLIDQRVDPAGFHRLTESVKRVSRHAHHLAGARDVSQLLGQLQQPDLVSNDILCSMNNEGYLSIWF